MNDKPVKERILETAGRLFYEQGYRATGINQIIKESKSAKASFYLHFPSKEALCIAYLEERHIISHERQKMFISKGDSPVEKICSLFENIRYNAVNNNFNGCPFLNISSEINESESDIRRVVIKHKSRLLELIRGALPESQWNSKLAEMIYLVYEGTNIAVKNIRCLEPIDSGINAIKVLLQGEMYE